MLVFVTFQKQALVEERTTETFSPIQGTDTQGLRLGTEQCPPSWKSVREQGLRSTKDKERPAAGSPHSKPTSLPLLSDPLKDLFPLL